MDAVVLAAGRGERVSGLAAPYHKPLLPIDGVPLVVRAVRQAFVGSCDRVVVVVAPENALPIAQVLRDVPVTLVVQSAALGPGHALRVGLEAVDARSSPLTLVLLGDNINTDSDVAAVITSALRTDSGAVGVRHLRPAHAARFTRWDRNAQHWVERVPVNDSQVDSAGTVTCWVGPVVVRTETAVNLLPLHPGPGREWLLGPNLVDICGADAETVNVTSHDVGTVASYLERTYDYEA